MLMWFLDLRYSVFAILIIVFFAIILIKIASLKKDDKTITAMLTALLAVMISTLFLIVSINLFYGDKEKCLKIATNKTAFTLGELWCNYAEFKGELCKDYVEYVLNNQKKDRQVQFEKAQAKQQKLDEEKAHKDTIRANYENLVNELQKGGVK